MGKTSCHSAKTSCHSAKTSCHSPKTSCHSPKTSCHSASTCCPSARTYCSLPNTTSHVHWPMAFSTTSSCQQFRRSQHWTSEQWLQQCWNLQHRRKHCCREVVCHTCWKC